MKKIIVISIAILMIFTSCSNDVPNNSTNHLETNTIKPENTQQSDVLQNDTQTSRGKIVIQTLEDIDVAIQLMTLEEKAGQMIQAERAGIQLSEISKYNIGSILSGGGSVPDDNSPEGWVTMYNRMQKVSRNSSSGIPLIYGIDAVHGHNNVENAVIFPHNIGLGASNNPELVREIGAYVAKDINATGLNWNFAPAVSIVQDIRWGRTYESFSEDVLRVETLGSAYIEGLQSQGVMATTKHYIGDGYTTFGTGEGTNLIDRGEVTVPRDLLLNLYLPAYKAAIASGTKTIMASFNSVDGVKMHEHKELLTTVLRGELGFEGLVISDWEAIHAIDGTLQEQVAASINAGVDMLMQPYNWKDVYEAIVWNVENQVISQERLNEAVRRVLVLKYEAGLFEDSFEKSAGVLSDTSSRTLARKAVSESLVLLKNDNQVLPLNKDIKVFLIGPASDNVGIQCGGWTQSWQGELTPDLNNGVSLKDALKIVLEENGGELVLTKEEADVIVLAIGETPYAEMQGDTADLSLNGPKSLEGNLEAINSLTGSHQPIITIVVAGRPLLVDTYITDWDALIMAWLPGTEGLGFTDVLFGDQNFKGTLPVTWPKLNRQASDAIYMNQYETQDHQFKYGFGLTYE